LPPKPTGRGGKVQQAGNIIGCTSGSVILLPPKISRSEIHTCKADHLEPFDLGELCAKSGRRVTAVRSWGRLFGNAVD